MLPPIYRVCDVSTGYVGKLWKTVLKPSFHVVLKACFTDCSKFEQSGGAACMVKIKNDVAGITSDRPDRLSILSFKVNYFRSQGSV